jgi:hypothetical protein
MSETKNKPPMTEWDRKVFAHLESLIEQRKVGKMKLLSDKEVFGELRKKIDKAKRERTSRFNVYQQQTAYV